MDVVLRVAFDGETWVAAVDAFSAGGKMASRSDNVCLPSGKGVDGDGSGPSVLLPNVAPEDGMFEETLFSTRGFLVGRRSESVFLALGISKRAPAGDNAIYQWAVQYNVYN